MLIQLDNEQQQALQGLSKSAQWAKVEKILKSELDEVYSKLTYTVEISVIGHLQGRAQMIRDLIATVQEAANHSG